MRCSVCIANFLLLWVYLQRTMGQMNFFASAGDVALSSKISAPCVAAINMTIKCPSQFTSYPNSDYSGPFTASELDGFCSSECEASLKDYRSGIVSQCSKDAPIFDDIPATFLGDRMAAYQNRTCLKDKDSGQYCNLVNANWTQSLPDHDIALPDLPKASLCSFCFLSLLQAIESTPYSNYDESFVIPYQDAQKVCGVKYPTDVKPWPFNINQSDISNSSEPNVNSSFSGACLSGKNIGVSPGKTCQDIAVANSVATATLRLINSIFPDCSNLASLSSVCLPQSCTTYLVKANQSCFDVMSAGNIGFTELRAYNPAINYDCSNLISGESVCISPPGGNYTPTTIAGAGVTTSATYATATVQPPGPIPKGTTKQCGKYYEAQPGDICQQISLNNSIAVPLLESINPAIDKACDNLIPGFYYCVLPTANWNLTTSTTNNSTNSTATTAAGSTGTSAPPPPPGPTPSRTTSRCDKWHLVTKGEYCYLITQQEGISMAQLMAWNPSLKADCSNLILGDAYCVSGPAESSSSSADAATPAKSG